MHPAIVISIFTWTVGCLWGNARAFLDFEPEIRVQNFKNSGVIATHQEWVPHEEDYSFCQRMYPQAAFIRDARSGMGEISWDVSTSYGSSHGHIVYCEAETDEYGMQFGHFTIGPDESIYELQQEGEYSFTPIYDDYSY